MRERNLLWLNLAENSRSISSTIRHAVVEWAAKGCCTLYYTRAQVSSSCVRPPPFGHVSPNRPVVIRVRRDTGKKKEGLIDLDLHPHFLRRNARNVDAYSASAFIIYTFTLLDRATFKPLTFFIFDLEFKKYRGYRANGVAKRSSFERTVFHFLSLAKLDRRDSIIVELHL